jgi:hypothetical protein
LGCPIRQREVVVPGLGRERRVGLRLSSPPEGALKTGLRGDAPTQFESDAAAGFPTCGQRSVMCA